MEMIKKWALLVIIISVISAVLKMIIPEGNVKKSVHTVLSFVVLLVMVSPLMSGELPKLTKSFDVFEELSYSPETKIYEDVIKDSVENVLDKNSIQYNSVTAQMYINDDGYIIISEILIDLKGEDNKDNIIKLVSENTMFDSEIITVR